MSDDRINAPPERDARPAYVRTLDAERVQAEAELGAMRAGLHELRCYLHSAKFAPRADGREPGEYVHRNDVLLRMDETGAAALAAGARAASEEVS
jgi:hypothetical protein